MGRRLTKTLPVIFGLLLGLSACSRAAPYVFKEGEFDRNSPTFNKTPDDIDKVQICYNKNTTKPGFLQKIARNECSRYGKRARFQKQDILHCPLVTPVMATFLCLRPGS